MSNNIDQENPSINDDNSDTTNDRCENDYFGAHQVWSFFRYRGLNQQLRIFLRKMRDVTVTDSQPASSRAVNDLQSTTESQQRQNAREIISEEYTNIKWGERNLCEVSKKIHDAFERIVFWTKNLFLLPTGAAAKKSTIETTKLMNGWTTIRHLTKSLSRLYISCPAFFFKFKQNNNIERPSESTGKKNWSMDQWKYWRTFICGRENSITFTPPQHTKKHWWIV